MSREDILKAHAKDTGKLEINSTLKLDTMDALSIAYTPGVAEVCREIHEDESKARELTISGKTIAVISDGSAVLGLGNIGPKAALPVMEGKCAIFKEFAGIDAFPICLDTQDTDEIVSIVKAIAPNFAAINLEDIAAPRCFEIEERLEQELDIPVMHDDQHGTAIVATAALIGAKMLTHKPSLNIVIVGAGAAGTAIAKLLLEKKITDRLNVESIKVVDSKGVVSTDREDINDHKRRLAELTNQDTTQQLSEAMAGADIFIGVSAPGILTDGMIKSMNADPIIFALANPDPEVLPDDAINAGAKIVATGRSDFPNQINNALAYPGVFAGLVQGGFSQAGVEVKIAAVDALVSYHMDNLTEDMLLPEILDTKVPGVIKQAILDLKE